jgi:hypothetical protein
MAGPVMKVLHVLEATGGGTRRHILDLLPALQAYGVSCDLVASAVRTSGLWQRCRWLRARGVKVFEGRWRAASALGDAIACANRSTSAPRALRCRSLHSTNAGLLGRLARRRTRVARRLCTRALHRIRYGFTAPSTPRGALDGSVAGAVDVHFMAVSPSMKAYAAPRDLCKIDRFSSIHYGVDISGLRWCPLRSAQN